MYAGFVMTGQAMGGVIPALAAILLTSLDVEPRLLGPACFVVILGFILLAIGSYYVLIRNPFFLFHAEGSAIASEVEVVNHDSEVDALSYKRIFGRSWSYFLTGYVNYATTLSVFPALTSLGKYLISDRTHEYILLIVRALYFPGNVAETGFSKYFICVIS